MSGSPSSRPVGRPLRATALSLALAALAFGALGGLPGDSRSAGNRYAYPDTFPAGSGRAIAERACLICHSAMLVTQQAKDSTGWEKSLATMKTWGAPMSNTDKDTLREYLRARFGPKTPPAR